MVCETVDEYIIHCKLQVQKCKFAPNEYEEHLMEQLIIGVTSTEFKKSLLGKNATSTLNQAIDFVCTHEAASSHMSQLHIQQYQLK